MLVISLYRYAQIIISCLTFCRRGGRGIEFDIFDYPRGAFHARYAPDSGVTSAGAGIEDDYRSEDEIDPNALKEWLELPSQPMLERSETDIFSGNDNEDESEDEVDPDELKEWLEELRGRERSPSKLKPKPENIFVVQAEVHSVPMEAKMLV